MEVVGTAGTAPLSNGRRARYGRSRCYLNVRRSPDSVRHVQPDCPPDRLKPSPRHAKIASTNAGNVGSPLDQEIEGSNPSSPATRQHQGPACAEPPAVGSFDLISRRTHGGRGLDGEALSTHCVRADLTPRSSDHAGAPGNVYVRSSVFLAWWEPQPARRRPTPTFPRHASAFDSNHPARISGMTSVATVRRIDPLPGAGKTVEKSVKPRRS